MVGGRSGRGNIIIFTQDWESFTTALDNRLHALGNTMKNVLFYRAIHEILLSPGDFSTFVNMCLVNVQSPFLYLCQIHLGLRLTPPINEALFVGIPSAKKAHRESLVPLKMSTYHPANLCLDVGHYR